jgi:hypothetical protein
MQISKKSDQTIQLLPVSTKKIAMCRKPKLKDNMQYLSKKYVSIISNKIIDTMFALAIYYLYSQIQFK